MRASGESGLDLWIVDLDRTAEALQEVDKTFGLLPEQDRSRMAAMTNAQVRGERFAAHRALRVLIEHRLGRRFRAVEFSRSRLGRPSVSGSNLDFSLSHAGRYALVGLRADGLVGVDVELPREVDFPPQRKERLLRGAVSLAGRALPVGDERSQLIAAWSRLESFAKADGCGMAQVLGRIGVVGPQADHIGASEPSWPEGQMKVIMDLDVPDGYVGAVCLLGGSNGGVPDHLFVLRPFPCDARQIGALLDA